MVRRLVAAGAMTAVLGVGLWWLLGRGPQGTPASAPGATTPAHGSEAAERSAGPVAGVARAGELAATAGAPSTSAPNARRPLPPGGSAHAGRELEVERRVEAVLRAHPGVATLTSIACDARSCRVELETPDLDAFTPAYERLQEPEAGLPEIAARIALEKPVPLGENGTGPYRVVFTLWNED